MEDGGSLTHFLHLKCMQTCIMQHSRIKLCVLRVEQGPGLELPHLQCKGVSIVLSTSGCFRQGRKEPLEAEAKTQAVSLGGGIGGGRNSHFL